MVGAAYRWFERPIRWGIVGGVWAWESSRGSLGLGCFSGSLVGVAVGLRRGFGASAGAMMPRAGHWQCLPPVGIAFYSDSIAVEQLICLALLPVSMKLKESKGVKKDTFLW